VRVAREFEAAGAQWIHVVDLDAARTGEPVNRTVVAAITDAMLKIGKTPADQVHVVFQDVEKTNWGVNGKLAGDR